MLRLMLGLSASNSSPHSAASGFGIRVETPAGLIVAQLHVNDATTVRDVKVQVAKVAPRFPVSSQQLLVSGCEGHGVLQDDSVLKEAVEHMRTEQHDRGSGQQNGSAGHAVKLKAGDVICLCLIVSSVTWSKSRSHPELVISHGGRQITREKTDWSGASGVGAISLSEPGHFFTVQIRRMASSFNYVSVGIVSESYLPSNWKRLKKPREVNTGSVVVWYAGSGIRGVGVPLRTPGDRITIAIARHNQHSLVVVATINGAPVPGLGGFPLRHPPFVPLCTIATGSVLEMQEGLGDPRD